MDDTVNPFNFASIKFCVFTSELYSRPFNFAFIRHSSPLIFTILSSGDHRTLQGTSETRKYSTPKHHLAPLNG